MVPEAIIGALVGGGAAVAGSAVQAWFNRQNTKDRIEAENQRQRAEIYAGEKVEALSRLHRDLVESRQLINHKIDQDGKDLTQKELQEELIPISESLNHSVERSYIFLEGQQRQKILDYHDKIVDSVGVLEKVARGESVDTAPIQSELTSASREALEVVEQEINGPIEEFESS